MLLFVWLCAAIACLDARLFEWPSLILDDVLNGNVQVGVSIVFYMFRARQQTAFVTCVVGTMLVETQSHVVPRS